MCLFYVLLSHHTFVSEHNLQLNRKEVCLLIEANGITGTYHGFKFEKYAHRYLAEAQYRFNRRFDLSTMLPRLLYAGVRTGSSTENWLRLAEARHYSV